MGHFLSVHDLGAKLNAVLDAADRLKLARRDHLDLLKGQSMAMIFEKNSTRTRLSFEVGFRELGGHPLFLSKADLQLGAKETIADSAKVISRYVDVIMYRAYRNSDMQELALHSTVPVINALDDLEHPCQAFADLMTLRERWGKLTGKRLVYIGDGNNVCNSLLLACAYAGMDMTAVCPEGFDPDAGILADAKRIASERQGTIDIGRDPKIAAVGADALYTDVWVSMGQEDQAAAKVAAFAGFCIDEALLATAAPGAWVLHCLPASRGKEITDGVMDGSQSAIWDQAENRLHVQKAIILELLGIMP